MIIQPDDYCRLNTDTFPVFLKPWYLDAVYGSRCWSSFLEYHDPQIFAVLPFSEYPKHCITMPSVTQYAGPYLQVPELLSRAKRYSLHEQLLCGLLKQVDESELDCYAQRWGGWIENWMPTFWYHYQNEPRFTYLLDCTRSYDEIYHNYSTQVRNKLKKSDIYINEEKSVHMIYELLRKSLQLQQKEPKFSYANFENLANATFKHQSGTAVYAYVNEHCCSGAFLIWDHNRMYYYIAGNDREYQMYYSSTVLLDYCIKLACKQKKIFDFTGSMLPSLSRFYRSFGSTLYSYPIINKIFCKDEIEAKFHKSNLRNYIFKF